MPLKRLPHRDLEVLIRAHLSVKEDEPTALLSRRLRAARRRGYLTQGELVSVCRWKSARAIQHIQANNHHRVRAATCKALASGNEQDRLAALLQLKGVSVPMASAILTLLDPKRYGVIDIRVWQLLHEVGAVRENRRGAGFSADQWLQFLTTLRHFASKLRVTARTIERTLFNVHKAHQQGRLYDSVSADHATRPSLRNQA